MKASFIKRSLAAAATSFVAIAAVLGFAGSASAIQIPYVPGEPLPSIEHPVFNTFTNVPNGVGNEADFVRIRPSTGDVANNGEGGVRNALYVNGHRSDCNVGDKYDIRTYIHNGANEEFNDNGNGTAVAHETMVRMNAPLNTPGTTFTFTSVISAKDVSPVTDTARLYCNGEDVMLKLVPQSVKVYSKHYSWQQAPNSAVNGDLPIGSRVLGDGNVWGCWDERVLVAYIVEVVEVPEEEPEEPVYTCDLLALTVIGDRKYRFTTSATAQNATIVEYRYDFKDGSDILVTPKNTVDHTYKKAGNYKPSVQVTFNVDGELKTVGGANCVKELTIKDKVEPCPVDGKGHLPKDSPDCYEPCPYPGKEKIAKTNPDCKVETPKTLPNTGAGELFGILTVVATVGAVLHRKFTLSR